MGLISPFEERLSQLMIGGCHRNSSSDAGMQQECILLHEPGTSQKDKVDWLRRQEGFQVTAPEKQVFPVKSFFRSPGNRRIRPLNVSAAKGEAEMAFPEVDHFLAHSFGWFAM